MYSQKNVLQVFVSKFNVASAASVLLKNLPDGAIGLFAESTEVSVTSLAAGTAGFVAFNDGGVIKRGATILNGAAVADIAAHVAQVARKEKVTVSAAVAGEYYQVTLTIKDENGMGEEMLQGVCKAVAADTTTTIATALALSLNRSLARRGTSEVTVTSAAADVVIETKPKAYVPGRKKGGFQSFGFAMNYPASEEALSTVVTAGTEGIGEGYKINSLELFAQGNSDSVSRNEFRTGQALELNSLVSKKYKVWAVNTSKDVKTAYAGVPVDSTLICAFQNDGGAIS